MEIVNLDNEQQTLDLGLWFARNLTDSCIVYLMGNLGSGKTTFVRGVLTGLGYTGRVKSPTYTIVESYNLANYTIFHFDLYRLSDPEELEYMGIRDYFDTGNQVFIEWPEIGYGCLPPADICLQFSYNNCARTVGIESVSIKGEQLLDKLDLAAFL